MQHRGYSRPLNRALVDFGSDQPFNQVHNKMKEHYGTTVPDSAPRKITLKHASAIAKEQEESRCKQKGKPEAKVISETDGSMVPIVNINEEPLDKRKKKTVCYKEARLTLAHAKGSKSPIFSATFGSVKATGKHMAHCVSRVGIDQNTHIHCVGDGASWIAEQVEEQFGSQATYLIDLYHVCEYLAAAAPACSSENAGLWIEKQKELLKQSNVAEVLESLRPYIEPDSVEKANAPVRVCFHYLANRLKQLDYKSAIEEDLPIGSGEIESAHRYIIQKRLKIQGAWWLETTAENMLALRTHRANRDWEKYWEKLAA